MTVAAPRASADTGLLRWAPPVALIVVREGRLPDAAREAAAEARGRALVVGSGAAEAARKLGGASEVGFAETGPSPAEAAVASAALLEDAALVICPGSPDGRDAAPVVAHHLGRPLLPWVVSARVASQAPEGAEGLQVHVELLRCEGTLVVPALVEGPAVVTLVPGVRDPLEEGPSPEPAPTGMPAVAAVVASGSVVSLGLVEPDPATVGLADARRVLAGGAGLVPKGADDRQARAVFELLLEVARAMGAAAGATRVVTDAGWLPYDRQIGTTGMSVNPELYLALGISGATQHLGGIGDPRTTVSVNLDPSCPMTAAADLGLVCDAFGLLVELARRAGVALPDVLEPLALPTRGEPGS